MNFITKEQSENISYLEKNEKWLSLWKNGETIAMLTEGFFLFMLCFYFITTINVPEKYAYVSLVFAIVMILLSVFLCVFFVAIQQLAFANFVSAWSTPTWLDDIWKGVLSLVIAVIICFADKDGSSMFFNSVNDYDPKITEDYEKDKRVNNVSKDRQKIEKEKSDRVGSMICVECNLISAKYEAKKRVILKDLRKGEGTATWISVENNKITSRAKALDYEKNGAILEAKARFEQIKENEIAKYEQRIFSLDTTKSKLVSSIDSVNATEFNRQEEKIRQNMRYSGGISIITQIILLISRLMQVKIYRKAGYEFASMGKFMAWFNIFNTFIDSVKFKLSMWGREREIASAKSKGEEFQKVLAIEDKAKQNLTTAIFLDNKIENFRDAKMFMEKPIITDGLEKEISEKDVTTLEILDEKDIILQYQIQIETGLKFLNNETDKGEIDLLLIELEYCKTALKYLV